ncbi:MAG: hypothetical protein JXB14_07670 [Candidatus Altiarchaeota archaeon]|nr:hypothetical protein [Candidatus Altiarchaeota archaeon]
MAKGSKPKKPPRIYLKKPRFVSWEEARGMERIPRGVIVKPKVQSRSLGEISVSVTPEGVFQPYYRKTRAGELELVRYEKHPDLPTAIRANTHKMSSIKDDDLRYVRLHRTLGMLHADIYKNWAGKTEAERAETLRQVERLRTLMQGRQVLTEWNAVDRRRAVERLDRFLEDPRPGTLPSTLVGVNNDIVARRGDLFRQLKYLPRRKSLLVQKKIEMDWSAFSLLDQMSEVRGRMQGAEKLPREQKEAMLVEMRRMRDELGGRVEPELKKDAHQHAKNAVGLLWKNKLPEAVEQLREASKAIAVSNSRYAWLYPERLEQVAKSRDMDFRRKVAGNQATLYRDNLEYWLSESSHEPLRESHIVEHLELIGEILPNTHFEAVMKRAAQLLRQRRLKMAQQVLSGAVEHKLYGGG